MIDTSGIEPILCDALLQMKIRKQKSKKKNNPKVKTLWRTLQFNAWLIQIQNHWSRWDLSACSTGFNATHFKGKHCQCYIDRCCHSFPFFPLSSNSRTANKCFFKLIKKNCLFHELLAIFSCTTNTGAPKPYNNLNRTAWLTCWYLYVSIHTFKNFQFLVITHTII